MGKGVLDQGEQQVPGLEVEWKSKKGNRAVHGFEWLG